MKVSSPFHIPVVAGVCLLIFAATAAQAANTWDGGGVDSNWGTATNWDDDLVPAAKQALTFAGSTGLASVNNTGSREVKGFTFAVGAGAFTLSGNAVTLTDNITNSSANTQTINLDMATSGVRTIILSSNAVVLGGVISGSGGFDLGDSGTPGGTVTLSGSNTFTGGVAINTGGTKTKTLNIGHANALGTGLLTIKTGNSANNRIDNTSGAAMAIANNVLFQGNGPVEFLGTKNLTINGATTLSANEGKEDLAGRRFRNLQVDANTLTLASNVYISGSNAVGGTLATLGAGNLTIEGVVSNYNGGPGTAGGIDMQGSGTLTLSNAANTYTGATTFSGGSAGVMVVTKLADGGQDSSIGKSSNVAANLGSSAAGAIGVLRYIGSGDSTDRLFTLSNTGIVFKIESSGSGVLDFTNTGAIVSDYGATERTLVLGGTYTGTNLMAPLLASTGAAGDLLLRKEGAGTWKLTNNNGYKGTTTVNAGTLLVSGAGSINSSSAITVNGNGSRFDYTSSTGLSRNVILATGGGFYHNGSTNYSGTLTWTNGVLGGTNWNGTSLNNLTVNANRTISPGNSPGTALTVDQTWGTDGSYIWEINNATGTAGADPGWDLVSGTGTLTISANSTDKFTIYVTSLSLLNAPGDAANFNSATNYQWRIADFANPVSGFSADKFAINTSGFSNAPGSIFSVVLGNDPSITGGDNTQIYLTYAAIPEPSTGLLLGFGLATLLLRRRRK